MVGNAASGRNPPDAAAAGTRARPPFPIGARCGIRAPRTPGPALP